MTPLWTTVDFVYGDVGEGPHFVGFLQPPSDLVTNSSLDIYVNSSKVRQRNTFKTPRLVKMYKNRAFFGHFFDKSTQLELAVFEFFWDFAWVFF